MKFENLICITFVQQIKYFLHSFTDYLLRWPSLPFVCLATTWQFRLTAERLAIAGRGPNFALPISAAAMASVWKIESLRL